MAVATFNNESENKKKVLLNNNINSNNSLKQNGVLDEASTSGSGSSSMNTSKTGKSAKSKKSKNGTRCKGPQAVAVAPDGGWGWVVAFSSFMVSFVLDGVCFTFGFFFNDFQSYFGTNKSTTSFISSCLNGTYMITGPIASGLVNSFGCRKVAFVGAVMTSVSFFLSTFSPNVETMIILYGVCGGIGFGLMYLPAIVMVGYYFDKRRALATGIAVCGSGIGGFIFAPLTEALLQAYHWKGAMWIIAAICLNGVVFASLFRPLKPDDDVVQTDDDVVQTTAETDLETREAMKKRLLCQPENPIYRCKSLDIYQPPGGQLDKNFELARLGHSMFLDIEPRTRKHLVDSHHEHTQSPFVRKDVFYAGSLQNLPEYKMADTKEQFVRSMLSLGGSDVDSTRSERLRHFFRHLFSDIFDLSLLKSITFVIYSLSCFLCMMGFFVPFIYIPAVAVEQGMTTAQTTWIISTIGIVNTVGRLFVGYISDKDWCDAILVNVVSLVIAGAATLFVPYYNMYFILIIYGIVFGFSIAAFVSLRSIIIVDLLGIDKLTNSFGLVVLSQGLSTFIGAPIAGALSDATGNYVASFYLAGSVIILSGLICLPLRRLNRWEKERAMKTDVQSSTDTNNPAGNENKPMLKDNAV